MTIFDPRIKNGPFLILESQEAKKGLLGDPFWDLLGTPFLAPVARILKSLNPQNSKSPHYMYNSRKKGHFS